MPPKRSIRTVPQTRTATKRMPRTKKLTKIERNLIENPPTKTTWICPGPHHSDKGTIFDLPNSGKNEKCWLCTRPKPARAKLLWNEYVKACEKAEIEPGLSGSRARRLLIENGHGE